MVDRSSTLRNRIPRSSRAIGGMLSQILINAKKSDELDVLVAIELGARTVKEMALKSMTGQQCPKIVGRLLEEGLISRFQDDSDGRIWLYELSPDGVSHLVALEIKLRRELVQVASKKGIPPKAVENAIIVLSCLCDD